MILFFHFKPPYTGSMWPSAASELNKNVPDPVYLHKALWFIIKKHKIQLQIESFQIHFWGPQCLSLSGDK